MIALTIPRACASLALAAALMAGAAMPAAAQSTPAAPAQDAAKEPGKDTSKDAPKEPAKEPGKAAVPTQPRFAFAPVEGGALKLDTENGKVSLCAKGAGGFACTAVPDSRDAYEAEIARLQAENEALRRGGAAASPGAGTPGSQLDAALGYAEQLYGRLKQMVDELRAPNSGERL